MLKFIKSNIKVIVLIVIVISIILGIIIYSNSKDISKYMYNPDVKDDNFEIYKYAVNEYEVINISNESVYKLYYKDFIRLLINDPKKAYDKLDNTCKEQKYNNSYEKFYEEIKKIDKKSLLESELSRYDEQKDRLIFVDNNERSYIFYENGVWNYKVYIVK